MLIPILIVVGLLVAAILMAFAVKYADDKICRKCWRNNTEHRVIRSQQPVENVGGIFFSGSFLYCTNEKVCKNCGLVVQKNCWTEQIRHQTMSELAGPVPESIEL